jgi:hypothetical protein
MAETGSGACTETQALYAVDLGLLRKTAQQARCTAGLW